MIKASPDVYYICRLIN